MEVKISILFLCLLLSNSRYIFASEQLRFCYELQPGPPYIFMGNASPKALTGIIIDLIKATSIEAGIDIKLYQKPWKRCIFDVGNGNADGVLAAIWQPSREEWGLFPKTQDGMVKKEFRLWTVNYLIFTNKETPLEWDGQTLSGVSTGISAPLGYIVFEKLKQQGLLNPNVSDPNNGFLLVANNRLNGYIIDGFTGRNIIKKLQLSHQITPLEIPYMQADLHLVLSKKSKNVLLKKSQLIWQSLAKVRKRDEALLREKYATYLEPQLLTKPSEH